MLALTILFTMTFVVLSHAEPPKDVVIWRGKINYTLIAQIAQTSQWRLHRSLEVPKTCNLIAFFHFVEQ